MAYVAYEHETLSQSAGALAHEISLSKSEMATVLIWRLHNRTSGNNTVAQGVKLNDEEFPGLQVHEELSEKIWNERNQGRQPKQGGKPQWQEAKPNRDTLNEQHVPHKDNTQKKKQREIESITVTKTTVAKFNFPLTNWIICICNTCSTVPYWHRGPDNTNQSDPNKHSV